MDGENHEESPTYRKDSDQVLADPKNHRTVEDNGSFNEAIKTTAPKILVAEDNPVNMLLVSLLIKNLIPGVSIVKAKTAKKPLRKF